LLHVLPRHALDPGVVLAEEARARTYLDTLATQIRAAGVRAAPVVRSGSPAEVILDEAATVGASLIIMGANVRSRLVTLLRRSVAGDVMRSARCPVLLVHPEGQISRRRPRMLRSFHDDSARMGPLARRHLGIRTIEVARIVGSECRAQDFGPDFHWRRGLRQVAREEQRFNRVLTATHQGSALPPIVVYQLGFGYYVEDGHHRVAAALLNGQTEIDADVTEFVPVESEPSNALFAARTSFEMTSGLTELGATRADSYGSLTGAIVAIAREEHISNLRYAANRWENRIYRPLWSAIRAREASARFPGERTADIVARVVRLHEQDGLTWEDALDAVAPAQRLDARSSTLRSGCCTAARTASALARFNRKPTTTTQGVRVRAGPR
jgi:hypothetical protein